MNDTIIFGRVRAFKSKKGNNCHRIDYLDSNGKTHRELISQFLYDKLVELNPDTGSNITVVYEVDDNNHATLIDII